MPIPAFTKDGWLPAGIHVATWAEIEARYGVNKHRLRLLNGLRKALAELKQAGCRRAYLDGSFVTDKAVPRDFDGVWEEQGVDPTKLHPVLKKFGNKRAAQKAVFLGEFFPASLIEATTGSPFLNFFQADRATGQAKGIVAIDLTGWQP